MPTHSGRNPRRFPARVVGQRHLPTELSLPISKPLLVCYDGTNMNVQQIGNCRPADVGRYRESCGGQNVRRRRQRIEVFNGASTTSGRVQFTIGETTASTSASTSQLLRLATLGTSTAVPLTIAQGAGVNATNAPLTISVLGGTGGANAGATSPDSKAADQRSPAARDRTPERPPARSRRWRGHQLSWWHRRGGGGGVYHRRREVM